MPAVLACERELGHLFERRSETQWEHLRVSMLTSRAKSMQADGWQIIGSGFPYTYLKRELDTPALIEPGDESPPAPSKPS